MASIARAIYNDTRTACACLCWRFAVRTGFLTPAPPRVSRAARLCGASFLSRGAACCGGASSSGWHVPICRMRGVGNIPVVLSLIPVSKCGGLRSTLHCRVCCEGEDLATPQYRCGHNHSIYISSHNFFQPMSASELNTCHSSTSA